MVSAIKRHGGKAYEARKIIALMPPHQRYTEPYFGSGAVLFAKDPNGVAEIVNDIDDELMNFWQVLRHDSGELQRALAATPLSETAFRSAVRDFGQGRPLDRAVNFFIRVRQSRQALGKDYVTPTTRLRRGMNEHVSAWLSAVDGLPEAVKRLRRVELRNMDALEFIRLYDHSSALHYVDPPYLHETRTATKAYGDFEMSMDDHARLLDTLARIDGMFLLSGYPNKMYDDMASRHGWFRVDIPAHNRASGKKRKDSTTECVWMNFSPRQRLHGSSQPPAKSMATMPSDTVS